MKTKEPKFRSDNVRDCNLAAFCNKNYGTKLVSADIRRYAEQRGIEYHHNGRYICYTKGEAMAICDYIAEHYANLGLGIYSDDDLLNEIRLFKNELVSRGWVIEVKALKPYEL